MACPTTADKPNEVSYILTSKILNKTTPTFPDRGRSDRAVGSAILTPDSWLLTPKSRQGFQGRSPCLDFLDMGENRSMKRRDFLKGIAGKAVVAASAAGLFSDRQLLGAAGEPLVDAATAKDWLARWEANILNSVRARYCDKEMG